MERQGFREMINTFCPGYTLPSRAHLTTLMKRKYDETPERVKVSLKGQNKIHSPLRHTLASPASLLMKTGGRCPITSSQCHLKSDIQLKVLKFGISMTKRMVVVHDNAANVAAAIGMLEKKHMISSLRCAGHNLQ